MRKFISFSGGVESTTMCILYGADATAIFSDAGDEHQKMYERLDMVEREIKKIHPNFQLLKIHPSVTVLGKKVSSISEAAVEWKYLPSSMARYCTSKFKIMPIDDYLSKQGECELMIGFNADEEPNKDRTGNLMKCKNVRYSYPLYEDGYTRDDCEAILNQYGLHPNLPPYMSRGGCWHCFFKSKKEYKALYLFEPSEFQKAVELEQKIQDRKKKFFTIMGNGQSMTQLAAECESEIAMFGHEAMKEMYTKIKSHEPCGAFCHR
jgi:3'-phosphoadenosine 5'-phosphosulfate sulfotransferase (PAPS reductase)/FAD synthetase